MKENPYPIAPEGFPFIIAAFVATLALGWATNWMVALLPFGLFLFCVWFFRDPKRAIPTNIDSEQVICPADGVIVDISNVDESRYLNRRVKKISIFMSPLNVHVNRSPLKGEVTAVHYNPGKFFNAKGPKASLDNEQNAIVMKTPNGIEFMFVQIAGFIARRIVCHCKPGDQLDRGQRMGLIRFGSRVDVYLPEDSSVQIKMNEVVTAGETILAVAQTLPQSEQVSA